MSEKPEELASQIAAFLNKHAADRSRILVADYPFDILGIDNVSVPNTSINVLPDETVQFNGKATIHQVDGPSEVRTKSKITFHGVAFFAEDVQGDNNLLKVSLDQIKLRKS